jgi:putative lipoic acid-binding regulatory protein
VDKPEIEYPTAWKYKVVGVDEIQIRKAVDEVLKEKEYSFRFSKSSRSGKYLSFEISLVVSSEEERYTIFGNLKSRTEIQMVI